MRPVYSSPKRGVVTFFFRISALLATHHAYAAWSLSYRNKRFALFVQGLTDWCMEWRRVYWHATLASTSKLDWLANWTWDPVFSRFYRKESSGVQISFISKDVTCDKRRIVGLPLTYQNQRQVTQSPITCQAEPKRETIDQGKRKVIRRPASLAWGRSPLLLAQSALLAFLSEVYSLANQDMHEAAYQTLLSYPYQVKFVLSLWHHTCTWRGNRPLWLCYRSMAHPFIHSMPSPWQPPRLWCRHNTAVCTLNSSYPCTS